MDEIKVSICVLSYNHEKYLRDCLDGIVMQKTTFSIEAWVHDDASTDSSSAIIKEYQERYPDIIKPILQTENQYSKGGGILAKFVYPRCVGAYIALCEGDDYWTDPLKLQKQVDFMEAHEDYSLCFTNSIVKRQGKDVKAINAVWDTYSIEDIISTNALNMSQRGDHVTSCGHTSTLLYRVPKKPLPGWISKCFIGDEPLFIALGQFGKAKFLDEVMSVYREGVGVSSNNFSFENDWRNRIKMYQIINKGLNNKYSKIINPIIKEYKLKVFKLLWKNARKREAICFAIKAIR